MRTRELVAALALMSGCSHKAPQAEATPQASAAGAAAGATVVGAKAPGGQLTQVSGTKIALADVLHQHAQTVVVFYRGFY
jgi:uncharacterized protein YcfL